jgi:hypothetical protein
MATKDISRSALEGGRSGSNKFERNESHVRERSRAKAWLSKVKLDSDLSEESVPEERNRVRKEFHGQAQPLLSMACIESWTALVQCLQRTYQRVRYPKTECLAHRSPAHAVGGSGRPFSERFLPSLGPFPVLYRRRRFS